jgi:hypothetical protein
MVIFPSKTNSELVVDPNAVLPFPVASQFLKTVARRILQVLQPHSEVDRLQFSDSRPRDLAELPAAPCQPELPSFLVRERSNHRLL